MTGFVSKFPLSKHDIDSTYCTIRHMPPASPAGLLHTKNKSRRSNKPQLSCEQRPIVNSCAHRTVWVRSPLPFSPLQPYRYSIRRYRSTPEPGEMTTSCVLPNLAGVAQRQCTCLCVPIAYVYFCKRCDRSNHVIRLGVCTIGSLYSVSTYTDEGWQHESV